LGYQPVLQAFLRRFFWRYLDLICIHRYPRVWAPIIF
jgi:hypothetical protein